MLSIEAVRHKRFTCKGFPIQPHTHTLSLNLDDWSFFYLIGTAVSASLPLCPSEANWESLFRFPLLDVSICLLNAAHFQPFLVLTFNLVKVTPTQNVTLSSPKEGSWQLTQKLSLTAMEVVPAAENKATKSSKYFTSSNIIMLSFVKSFVQSVLSQSSRFNFRQAVHLCLMLLIVLFSSVYLCLSTCHSAPFSPVHSKKEKKNLGSSSVCHPFLVSTYCSQFSLQHLTSLNPTITHYNLIKFFIFPLLS